MDEQTAHNLAQQASLYGRPLGDVVHELTHSLGLTQGRLAELLGMSAPMLSQLATGRRVKIGNPQAVARLQALLELSQRAVTLPAEQLAVELERVRQSAATTLAPTTATTSPSSTASAADAVELLARTGTPAALLAAAEAARPHSAALADLLRQAATPAHHG